MIIRRINEEISYYRNHIQNVVRNKFIKSISEPLRSFTESLISRDIVHPLQENRLSGLVSLFKIITLPHNYKIVRTYIQDRLESLYFTYILEYVGLRECYSALINRHRIGVSTLEVCLMMIDSFCLRKIDKVLGELCTKVEDIVDYDFHISKFCTYVRVMFRGNSDTVNVRPCRFVEITSKTYGNSTVLVMAFHDNLISRLRYVVSNLSRGLDVRSGLLYYQLLQLS